jgi:hypothetical protein
VLPRRRKPASSATDHGCIPGGRHFAESPRVHRSDRCEKVSIGGVR